MLLRPYLIGGIGYSFLKIKRDWSNFDYAHFNAESGIVEGLQEDINHPLPRTIQVFPVGLGLQYPISQKFALIAESTYRLTTTDYLDGFSRGANPERNDNYYTHMVGLVFRFGVKNMWDCPPAPK